MIDEQFNLGHSRGILHLQTGAGKTLISAYLVSRALENGLRCAFVTRRKELVTQTYSVFDNEGIKGEIVMANKPNLSHNFFICSIDSLKNRDLGHLDFIVIDEAHDTQSLIYKNFMNKNTNSHIVGLTATPYSNLAHWQFAVKPIEAFQVRDMGFLLPERIFVPGIYDFSDIKKTAGDYNENELAKKMIQSAIVGDAVESWENFSQERPTVCFCVNIEHSKIMAKAFNDKGIPSVHVDANSSAYERLQAKKGLEDGTIKVVFNVNIFATGWDCPAVGCIHSLRPTHSLILWLQQVGRGLRPNGIHKDCIIIDNAANTFRHGTPYDIREANLNEKPKNKKETVELSIINCKSCFLTYEKKEECCPHCGTIPQNRDRVIKLVKGELIEFVQSSEKIKEIRKQLALKSYYQLKHVAKIKGWNAVSWAKKQVKEKYQDIYEEIENELH